MRIFIISICLIFIISISNSLVAENNNLAFQKDYSTSPAPNYGHTVEADNAHILTDGIYTSGHFWTQKTTLGWQNSGTVEIIMDLKDSANIGSILFSTARGENAGVNYPAHIFAFVGSAKNKMYYIGDLGDIDENIPGDYHTKIFRLDQINVSGRYVLLEVVPNGKFMFCDEIEVTQSNQPSKMMPENLMMENPRDYVEQLKQGDINKQFLLGQCDQLSEDREWKFSPELSKLKSEIYSVKKIDNDSYLSAETRLYEIRRKILAKMYPGSSILIDVVNPWISFSPFYTKIQKTRNMSIDINLTQNGSGYGAFLITNLAEGKRSYRIDLNSLPAAIQSKLYYVPYVKTFDMQYAADPLLPLSQNITLSPGESRMIFLSVSSKKSKSFRTELMINWNSKSISLPLNINVFNVKLPEIPKFSGINWAYFNSSLTNSVDKKVILNDLYDHFINVMVVPPKFLYLKPDPENDFSELDNYLSNVNRSHKILLFLDFRNKQFSTFNNNYSYMSIEWRNFFRIWQNNIYHKLVSIGFSESNIYLYPIDEMAKSEVDDFIKFATWIRNEKRNVKIYATINNMTAIKALDLIDIAQVKNKENVYSGLNKVKPELWIYRSFTKSDKPYEDVRLLIWRAFDLGYHGAGFWNYSDIGNLGSVWDDFDGKRPDYSVIYQKNGAIYSSRRWEAWKQGIEDYELLDMYSQQIGEERARQMANQVLSFKADIEKADEVKLQILNELTEK